MITAFSLKVAAAIAGLALVGGIGYGAGVYLGYFAIPFVSDPPEHSARYYPSNVIAYSWMTLNPGGGQRRHMTEMFSRMRDISSFREFEEDLEDLLDEAFDAEFEDLAEWIGAEASAALIDVDSLDGTVEFAATVAVRNREAAEDFIDNVLDSIEDNGGLGFDGDNYGDFDTWVEEEDWDDFELSIALSDDLLVLASAEHTLKIILDRVSGERTRTLASNDAFQEARAALPGRRFMSVYLDYENLQDALEDSLGSGLLDLAAGAGQATCGGLYASTPRWVAISAGAFERGLVFDTVTPLTSGGWPEAPELPEAAKLLPDDTLGFAAASFNPVVAEWRETLHDCAIADLYGDDLWEEMLEIIPPYTQIEWFEEVDRLAAQESAQPFPEPLERDATLGDALDVGLWAGSRLAGFDIEADLLDHLQGTAIISVLRADSDLEDTPIDAVAMFSYRPERASALDAALREAASLLEDELDWNFEPADVGTDRSAYLLDLSDVDDIGYAPGYVLHDGFLTFGTTEDTLEIIVSRQQGEGAPLASDEEYRRAAGELSDNLDILAYVSLQGIVRIVSDTAGALDREAEETLEETLGALAMSSSSKDGVSRGSLVLTLFPEG